MIVFTPSKRGEKKVLENLKVARWGGHHKTLRRNVSHTQCLVCRLKKGHLSPGQNTGSPETHLVAVKSAASLSRKLGKGISDLVCWLVSSNLT